MRIKTMIIMVILFASGAVIACGQTDKTTDTSEEMTTIKETTVDAPTEIVTEGITSKLHPIVYDELLLGGFDGERWLQAYEIADQIVGNEAYRLYSPEGYVGEGNGGRVAPDLNQGPYAEVIELEHAYGDGDILAVSGDWDSMPRRPLVQANSSQVYIDVVEKVLEEQGLSHPVVEILQNHRIDLDGDGTEEVLIYAEHSDDEWRFSPKEGTYSLLLALKIVDGDVKTIILEQDIHRESARIDEEEYTITMRYVYGISGIADLNGDGVLEIITSWEYYEGNGYQVYELKDNQFEIVIGNGWVA